MKDELVAFRVSSAEVRLLDDLVNAYGTNRSELIRMMIRREAEDRALELTFLRKDADQERLFELSKVISSGDNILVKWGENEK